MKVAIIGAGASGLMASIEASKKHDVVVYERNNQALKKLLLTGSGRCNLYNINNSYDKYHSSNKEIIKEIISKDELDNYLNIFQSMGLVVTNKNGYYYPISQNSQNVRAVLLNEAIKNNVKFKYDTLIEKIEYKNNKFFLAGDAFDKVIVTTGSKVFPKTGSDGIGYKIAKDFNHTITKLYPSLVSLITNTGYENKWAGKRVHGTVSLFINDKIIKSETGEIQFNKTGISGICVLNLSREVLINLNENNKVYVSINFLDWDQSKIITYFDKFKDKTISKIFDGFIDYEIANILFSKYKINKDKTWDKFSIREKEIVIEALLNFKVEIIGTKDFNEAQVCRGGIKLTEINPHTLESKLVKGLYFAGEILDVDGDCGGYNLTFAFLSGKKAGELND